MPLLLDDGNGAMWLGSFAMQTTLRENIHYYSMNIDEISIRFVFRFCLESSVAAMPSLS